MSDFVFRWRGWLMAPYGLLILLAGKPSAASFAGGLSAALCGEALRFWGVGYAGKFTRKAAMEAPRLVTAGPYARVRHPLYLGNFLMGLGGAVMAAGQTAFVESVFIFLACFLFYGTVYGILMPAEEKFLAGKFGEEYVRYKKETPRIIPGIKKYPSREENFSWSGAFQSEIHTLIPFAALASLLALKLR